MSDEDVYGEVVVELIDLDLLVLRSLNLMIVVVVLKDVEVEDWVSNDVEDVVVVLVSLKMKIVKTWNCWVFVFGNLLSLAPLVLMLMNLLYLKRMMIDVGLVVVATLLGVIEIHLNFDDHSLKQSWI